jgi:DNA-binding NtrC family response regulator
MTRVLIADNDSARREATEVTVRRYGYDTAAVDSGDAAVVALAEQPFAAALINLVLPGLDGIGVVRRLAETGIQVPLIVQAPPDRLDAVAAALAAGARDFLITPASSERLGVTLCNAIGAEALAHELRRIRHRREGRLGFSDLIAESDAMAGVLRNAHKAAASHAPVLIEGEPGTGKEFVARVLHGAGERSGRPFVALDCAQVPPHLIDAELFGSAGRFVEASTGTLFLANVTALPEATQGQLLTVLQRGEIAPPEARRPVRIDVRLISATTGSLLERVKAGAFREDLFYRLQVLPLALPPLRARHADIPPLVRRLLARLAAEEGRTISGVSAPAMAMLTQAAWPGNVRALQAALHRAVIVATGSELDCADFILPDAPPDPAVTAEALTLPITAPDLVPEATAAALPPPGMLPLLTEDGEMRPLHELEDAIIRFAIGHYRGQMSEVARRLRIGRSTLYRKLDTP